MKYFYEKVYLTIFDLINVRHQSGRNSRQLNMKISRPERTLSVQVTLDLHISFVKTLKKNNFPLTY